MTGEIRRTGEEDRGGRHAQALFNRSVVAAETGSLREEIAICDKILQLYGRERKAGFRILAANAMLNKGMALKQMGLKGQAGAVFDELEKRFGKTKNPAIREIVERASLASVFPDTLREFGRMTRAVHAKEEQKDLLEGTTYEAWEKSFRAAAGADNYALFRDHLYRLALPEKPKLMLEGTVLAIRATLAYTIMEGRVIPLDRFLEMQQYNPADAPDARYVFTFDLCGKAFPRVLADEQLILPDLADLYGHPWDPYKLVGYSCFWISHPDWSPLTGVEIEKLEKEVSDDLYYDYSEDELAIEFSDADESQLFVMVRDIEQGEEEDRKPKSKKSA
jgi:hypothetical protein